MENRMANVSFTLKNIAKEIKRAEKRLHALRRKVIKADVKKIDLNLRSLRKAHEIVGAVCRPHPPFWQTFKTKSK
jgi:hypothetical protein